MAVVVALGVGVVVGWWRRRDQRRRDQDRVVVRLLFPSDLGAEAVIGFVRSLTALHHPTSPLDGFSSVVFEVVSRSDQIEHRLRLPGHRLDFVLAQLHAAVPGVVVARVENEAAPTPATATELRLSHADRPLRTDHPEAVAAALLAAMKPVAQAEVVLQWVIVPARALAPLSARRRPRASVPTALRPGEVVQVLRAARTEETSEKERRDKRAEPLFMAVGRIGARAATRSQAAALMRQVAATLHIVHRPGVAWVRRDLPRRYAGERLVRATTPVVFPARLNAREVATMIVWPIANPSVAGVTTGASRRLAPADQVARRGRVLGVSHSFDGPRPVALSVADALHHLHIVGPTGVGKSTLLGQLVTQDITAGRSVVLIDPKGELVGDVLDRIPPQRRDDVIVLDPTDEERPVGLNLLHGAHEASELVSDAVIGIFHRLYAAFWGPRTQDVLHASLLTLATEPGMTLCELPTLLSNDGFRRRLVSRLDDPILLGFWAWYDALSPGERAQAIGPVMNKLRSFLLRRRVRNVIGQSEPTWSLADILNHRKVLLVNLAKGQLGAEAAALVGSLVVALLWQTIQARTARLPAFVTIDEFQDVLNVPVDLAEVLAQARGFGVGLTLAHQHLAQLDSRMRGAVLANARSRVVFQTAADDAAALAKQLGGGLTSADLTRLNRYDAYAACCVGGQVMAPASITTRPLPPAVGSSAAVRQLSRQRYGRDRSEVEAAIAARQDPGDSGPLGRRRRVS